MHSHSSVAARSARLARRAGLATGTGKSLYAFCWAGSIAASSTRVGGQKALDRLNRGQTSHFNCEGIDCSAERVRRRVQRDISVSRRPKQTSAASRRRPCNVPEFMSPDSHPSSAPLPRFNASPVDSRCFDQPHCPLSRETQTCAVCFI